MEKPTLISIQQFCLYYEVEDRFLISLEEYGLIEIVTVEENRFIATEKIKDIEQLMRLHYDLEINLPGIEVVNQLLSQITTLQQEVVSLRNKLDRHHEENPLD